MSVKTMKIRALAVATMLACGLVFPVAPASASDGSAATPPPQEDIRTQLASIEDPGARAGAESMVAELQSQGREVISVDAGTYVPVNNTAEGQMSTAGMPTDCHASLTISRSGQNIFNDVKSWCSVSFTKVLHHLALQRVNPYNPFDKVMVRDNWYTTTGMTTAWDTQVFPCNNYLLTDWNAYGSGALERNGVVYTIPALHDVMYGQNCGY